MASIDIDDLSVQTQFHDFEKPQRMPIQYELTLTHFTAGATGSAARQPRHFGSNSSAFVPGPRS